MIETKRLLLREDTPDDYDASIFIRDYLVYFFTSEFKEIPDDFEGTYFKSLGMMWRYNDEN